LKRLAKVRISSGKTQEEMAKIIGIAISTYNQYENSQRNIPYNVASKISEVLNVEISDIFLPTRFTVREN